MKKVTNKITHISIAELVDLVHNNSQLFVFYYSANKNYPTFLTKIHLTKYGWIPPLVERVPSFVGCTIEESIKLAAKSREIYVATKDEFANIFRTKEEAVL